MRIYLTGFMGSGKSYTGKQLASLLDRPFYDLDELIEHQAGKTIKQIFEDDGEDRFRQLEHESLLATLHLPASVIATGGGTPCFHDNMEWMNKHGLTIYLKTPTAILSERLVGQRAHRPLLRTLSEDELRHYIEELVAKRLSFYEMAHVIFETRQADENVAEQLFRYFQHLVGH